MSGFPLVWLAHIGFGMSLAIYILRNYMATLPKTVIESAKIDGASHFQTFYKLVLPMSAPALASFAIFQFLWVGTTCWSRWSSSAGRSTPGHGCAAQQPAEPAGRRLEPRHRGRHRDHDRADHRLPGVAALLRPRPHGGGGQGLTPGRLRGTGSAQGSATTR
ncbi:MAG: ABC transporter permease subunit [Nocardioides sp.]